MRTSSLPIRSQDGQKPSELASKKTRCNPVGQLYKLKQPTAHAALYRPFLVSLPFMKHLYMQCKKLDGDTNYDRGGPSMATDFGPGGGGGGWGTNYRTRRWPDHLRRGPLRRGVSFPQ